MAVFLGETLAILGELLAAKDRPWLGASVGAVGWPLLVYGYWAGCKSGSGIWQITAVSIGSILIAEPLLIISIFREAPGKHELIGCLLGAAGLVVASMKP